MTVSGHAGTVCVADAEDASAPAASTNASAILALIWWCLPVTGLPFFVLVAARDWICWNRGCIKAAACFLEVVADQLDQTLHRRRLRGQAS